MPRTKRLTCFVAGLTVAVAAASAADARSRCEAAAHDRKVTGTVLGALGGGLLGGAVAGHGSKGAGVAIGAVGGAVVGNQLSRVHCRDGYARRRTHSYARATTRSYPAYAGDPRYAANVSAQCRYVSRPYYDQAGRLLYAPMQVCD